MSFLTINGLDIDVSVEDGFEMRTDDQQTFARSEGLTVEGALHAAKRGWGFGTPWAVNDRRYQAERDWVKGRGHHFTFERVDGATTRFTKYSSDGGPGFANGISAGSARFGTWGAHILSGGNSSVTATFGSENRYSVSVWKLNSASSWILCSAVYDGATTTFYAGNSGTGVTTSFAWMGISAASGYLGVRLDGENEAGTNAGANYDGLMLLPYALTTPMLVARNGRTAAEPRFPYVEVDGDFLDDLNPVVCKGYVDSTDFTQVNQGGTQNARSSKLTLIEK